jgi:hypothetical protein
MHYAMIILQDTEDTDDHTMLITQQKFCVTCSIPLIVHKVFKTAVPHCSS